MPQYNIGEHIILAASEAEARQILADIDKPKPIPIATTDQVTEAVIEAVKRHLNALATAWHYDKYHTAMAYVGSSVPKYDKEGKVIRDWVAACWHFCENQQAKMPSALPKVDKIDAWVDTNIIKKLPTPPSRPT